MAYLGPYNELKKLYCILLPEIRCSDWNWGKLFMVVIKCECVQKKKKRKKCYWIVNLLFPPLCFIKSLYLTSLKIFNSSPSRRIKWYRFLYITLKVFHSTAPPTILIVVHLKPHRVNCQKHPTTSRLHYFTQAADLFQIHTSKPPIIAKFHPIFINSNISSLKMFQITAMLELNLSSVTLYLNPSINQ